MILWNLNESGKKVYIFLKLEITEELKTLSELWGQFGQFDESSQDSYVTLRLANGLLYISNSSSAMPFSFLVQIAASPVHNYDETFYL